MNIEHPTFNVEMRMMEGHAPSWPLMLDTTDATERVPPEMLITWDWEKGLRE